MPIYAYRCDACGFAKDVLQKMSEDPLTVCPECEQPAFKKQVTAAGFQLKGSGWYVTDFRGGSGNSVAPTVSAKNEDSNSGTSTSDASTSTSASTTTSDKAVNSTAATSANASSSSSDNKAA